MSPERHIEVMEKHWKQKSENANSSNNGAITALHLLNKVVNQVKAWNGKRME